MTRDELLQIFESLLVEAIGLASLTQPADRLAGSPESKIQLRQTPKTLRQGGVIRRLRKSLVRSVCLLEQRDGGVVVPARGAQLGLHFGQVTSRWRHCWGQLVQDTLRSVDLTRVEHPPGLLDGQCARLVSSFSGNQQPDGLVS